MTLKERARLLRQSTRSFLAPWGTKRTFRAKGIAVAGGGKCNLIVRVRYVRAKPEPMTRAFYGVGLLEYSRRKKWIAQRDAAANPTALRVKRKHTASAVEKISRHPDPKLKVGDGLQGAAKCARLKK